MNSKQARNPTCGLRDVLRRVVDAGSHITASARADQADTETLTHADASWVAQVPYPDTGTVRVSRVCPGSPRCLFTGTILVPGTAGRGDSKSTTDL